MAPRHPSSTTTRRSVGVGLGLTIVVGMVVGACAGQSSPSTGAPASPGVSMAGTDSPEPATPAPSSTSDASAAVTVDLGAVGTTPRGSLVTVHSFGPSDRSQEPPAGAAWLEADLEWCLPPTIVNEVKLGNIRYELKLELSDGTAIDPEAQAASPDEVYASDGTFKASECVRGPLVFAVPTAVTAESLLLVGGNGGMRWSLE